MIVLRPLKSPYCDKNGQEIWQGMKLVGMLGLFEVRHHDGVWYGVDLTGNYFNPDNRRKLLANLTNLPIADDSVVLK